MMVVGVDTHKSSHAMAAVAADTGLLASEREIAASDDGHRAALSWARALETERCGRSRTAGMSRGAWSRP